MTGVNRTGSTFLMALFTDLGLPTGFTSEEVRSSVGHGGLESKSACWFPDVYGEQPCAKDVGIFKHPSFALHEDWLSDERVGHVIVPLRKLEDVPTSREKPRQMIAHDHVRLSSLVSNLVKHDTPVTYLTFPRLLHDPEYTFRKLSWLMDSYNVSSSEFTKAHQARYHPTVTALLDEETDPFFEAHPVAARREKNRKHLPRITLPKSEDDLESQKSNSKELPPKWTSPPPPLKNVSIVTGTGRTGTTFLMALFTDVGMPTGLTKARVDQVEQEPSHGGLEGPSFCWHERPTSNNWTPCNSNVRIFKDPYFSLNHAWFNEPHVGHIIVPVRWLAAVASSRAKEGQGAGGYWDGAQTPQQMDLDDHVMLANLLVNCVEHDMDVTFLAFPRMLTDSQYTYTKLRWLMNAYNVPPYKYHLAHQARYHPAWLLSR